MPRPAALTAQGRIETAGESPAVEPFARALSRRGLELRRGETDTLQINVGLRCNQTCRHCHLNAGPGRREIMDRETIERVIDFARRGGFSTIDVTGGAPELNPDLPYLLERVRPLAEKVMVRANLTALAQPGREGLLELFRDLMITVVASFPSLSESQADAQRGEGVFARSIETFNKLCALGYGREGSGLELNLVSNPTGAFLPPEQAQAEKRFRRRLYDRWGVVFNNLFTFANVPLGRFRDWLIESGNLDGYLARLADKFNPCALDGVMCRTLVSVDWNGRLYDCDFNLAAGIPLGGNQVHVSEMAAKPEPGSLIAVGDHCYTCSAGAGFT